MKWILRIITAPLIAVLVIAVHILGWALQLSAVIFGIAGTIIGILALLTMLSVSVKNGIILFVVAFLVSPLGLPMAAAWLVGQLQRLRYTIQDVVYG